MQEVKDDYFELSDKILTAATEVHRVLGPGLLESVYEKALMLELKASGLVAENQVTIPVIYKGSDLGLGFRADILVNQKILLELKSVQKIDAVHIAQVITYLKILGLERGYILNFNAPLLKYGIKRVSI